MVAHYHELDLILLDLALPDANGVSIIAKLQSLAPTVPVVVLSATEDPVTVQQALEAGAAGYIPKSCSSYETISALRLVLEGEIYVPPALLESLDVLEAPAAADSDEPEPGNAAGLSPRQLEVLHLMARGSPNKVIARQLDLAEGTVKLHVASILRALKVNNRTEAVIEAGRRGLLPDADETGE